MRGTLRNCVLAALLPLTGCGPGGPPLCQVTGTATFDGHPIEEGEILFLAPDQKHGPNAGLIRNGKFELRVKAGQKRVEIRASKPMPGKTTTMGTAYHDYIPPRYNLESKLTEQVTPAGKNHFEFRLVSGRK